MTINTDRRARFRAVLSGPRCVHPGSVYDPLTARMAEEIGFEVGMFAGSVASLTVLGAPDLIVLTLSEFADQARRICRAGRLPLLVDSDHGYGNALSAMRTAQELEAAGVAAMTLEDTLLPRAFGNASTQLISIEEGMGKVRAALAARDDPSFCIVARTGAVSVTGLDDAIARTKAYNASGADAIFYTGIKTRAELDAVSAVATLPIIVGGVEGTEIGDLDYLSARGVRVALQGHQPFMAAAQAAYATLKALRDGTPPSQLQGLPKGLVQRMSLEDSYAAWTRDFLG